MPSFELWCLIDAYVIEAGKSLKTKRSETAEVRLIASRMQVDRLQREKGAAEAEALLRRSDCMRTVCVS